VAIPARVALATKVAFIAAGALYVHEGYDKEVAVVLELIEVCGWIPTQYQYP
jgi:hypothetical protein